MGAQAERKAAIAMKNLVEIYFKIGALFRLLLGYFLHTLGHWPPPPRPV